MINNIKELNNKEEVLDFFKKYFKENLLVCQRQMESVESFDKPAWAEFQAYQLGSIKILKKCLALFPDQGESK